MICYDVIVTGRDYNHIDNLKMQSVEPNNAHRESATDISCSFSKKKCSSNCQMPPVPFSDFPIPFSRSLAYFSVKAGFFEGIVLNAATFLPPLNQVHSVCYKVIVVVVI